ncbi:uncharacterized protein N7511_002681 [Penicillium nucicola]|uniref:uncharacterized protein n=1 Tax=Penicillium nucicola TaxID=1850975 RepID=UPI0025454EB7|nr:uncharacterized protein N7511_002681 [Penicillium nucicola]KAJ5770630.1 hypothetical protein N7511_002681 [Penicillium nucicola]
MLSITFQSIILVLLGGRAVSQHAAASQCLTSHLSKDQSWKSCCDGPSTGTIDLGGNTFDYTCNSFLSPQEEFAGLGFYNAYECANACVESDKCQSAFWDSKNNKCFSAPSHSQKITTDKYFTIQNRRPSANQSPNTPTDCQNEVDQAKADCQTTERERCDKRLADQEQLLREQLDHRSTEMCNEEKKKLTKQFEEDQAAREEKNRRAIQELEDQVSQLKNKNKDKDQKPEPTPGPGGTKGDQIEPRTPGPTGTPGSKVPSENEWKCPEQDGKEYTVLGVTYRVFCESQPSGQVMTGGRLNTKHPEFLMAMCSVDSNCQGIRAKSSSAELVRDYEFPPKQKSKFSGWWSIVPVSRKTENSAIVPDLFSQSTTAPRAAKEAKCPSIDGQSLVVGGDEFQVNCRGMYWPRTTIPARIAVSFRQCLVMCTIVEWCQGLWYVDSCWLSSQHEVLEKSTPRNQLSSSYVAMLTVPRISGDQKSP